VGHLTAFWPDKNTANPWSWSCHKHYATIATCWLLDRTHSDKFAMWTVAGGVVGCVTPREMCDSVTPRQMTIAMTSFIPVFGVTKLEQKLFYFIYA